MVTIEHAMRFEIARKKAKGDTRFLRFPASDHDFSHPKEQKEALEQTRSWFINTLYCEKGPGCLRLPYSERGRTR